MPQPLNDLSRVVDGDLLGTSFGLSMSGIGAWLIALVIPAVAVASPFFLFW